MRILIVDDEKPARTRLRAMIEEADAGEVVAEATNGVEAVALNGECRPDIVLLDIRMPGMDGLEVAQHLADLEHAPAVIFTTAYGEHALDAFEANAVGYLVKPIRKQLLLDALTKTHRLNRAQLQALGLDRRHRARTHISVRSHGKIELIPVDNIIYLQADHKYTTIRHTAGQALIEESLRQLENEFPKAFIRIHRNALVAVDFLRGMERAGDGRCEVTLRGVDDRLEVSRRHASSVRKLLK